MKVLILGATGFIGYSVARAFARAGHTVYGFTRSEAKGADLAKDEIIPVIGDISQSDTWLPTVREMSVVVDVSADRIDGPGLSKIILGVVEEVGRERTEKRDPPLVFIYTTGTWVYGSHTDPVNEHTPLVNVPELVKGRTVFEKLVMNSKHVSGIGCVYGRSGSLTSIWFELATISKEVPAFGSLTTRWPMVHQDDLGDAYVRAAERSSLVKGELFVIANDQAELLYDMLLATARVTGVPASKISFVDPTDWYEECLALSASVENRKARTILGWEPRKPSFVDGIEVYYQAWRAFQ